MLGVAGIVESADLEMLSGIAGVVFLEDNGEARALRLLLSVRFDPVTPSITGADVTAFCQAKRHLRIDTTATGGNASRPWKATD